MSYYASGHGTFNTDIPASKITYLKKAINALDIHSLDQIVCSHNRSLCFIEIEKDFGHYDEEEFYKELNAIIGTFPPGTSFDFFMECEGEDENGWIIYIEDGNFVEYSVTKICEYNYPRCTAADQCVFGKNGRCLAYTNEIGKHETIKVSSDINSITKNAVSVTACGSYIARNADSFANMPHKTD